MKIKKEESFLRSSSWRLLRLEGHMIKQSGIVCEMGPDSRQLYCDDETGLSKENPIRIKKSGLYELALSGVTFQVSRDMFDVKFGIHASLNLNKTHKTMNYKDLFLTNKNIH